MKKQTHTAIILDTSHSMTTIRDQAILFFNEQRKAARKSAKENPDIKHTLSLTLFGTDPNGGDREVGRSSGVRVVHLGVGMDDIPKLNQGSYVPKAMTPMYDGVGTTLKRLKALDDGGEQTAFLVIVISDGLENDSREYDQARIAKMIKKREKTGRWTFVYLGAEHDLSDVQKGLGLTAANMMRFSRTRSSTVAMAGAVATASTSYYAGRALGDTETKSFVSDRDEIKSVDNT